MRIPFLLALLAIFGLPEMSAHAANAGTAAAAVTTPDTVKAPAAAPAVAASVAPESRVSVLTAEQVIQILDETVDWYRTLGTQQQNASQPSDLLILFANRQTADKAVGLAFDIARANAELLSSEASTGQDVADASSPQALNRQQSQLEEKRRSLEQEMNDAKKTLAASGKAKQDVKAKQDTEAKLPELQGELAMVSARKNLLDTMADFVGESDAKGAGANALKAQIDAIAATVPTASAGPAAANTGAAGVPTSASSAAVTSPVAGDGGKAPSARTGIWDLASNVLKLRSKIVAIDGIDERTAALAETFKKISAPPLEQLKEYTSRSDALAAQADHADGDALKALRGQFDTLAWLFKQTSAILIPLTKEQVLLRQYRHNLANWKDGTEKQYKDAVAALGVRLAMVAGILAAVFVLGEVWRRAVLRYAHEPRRRYQLLLVRKIVLWVLVIAILGLSIVTEISTFATFAGLITAGVAVAMQSVLVSVVGYFFLIGKYGIRVGDRVQIGAVVGEVVDIGLVRMHLMELNTNGPLGPTGRVVAFANLIVFQASGGLFKQIPGVNLAWHEITLALPPVDEYGVLKEELLTAVSAVVDEYSGEITRQTKEIERSTASTTVDEATPHVQMHIAGGRMEALIRYPVSLQHAAQIDERVSEAVLKVIAKSTEEASRTSPRGS